MTAAGFPARLRVKRRREYLRVQRGGRRHHLQHFLVVVAHALDPDQPTRLGITVTRKVGPATQRNRIKRLVREVFRVEHDRFVPGLDVVWIAKKQANGVTFDGVRADMDRLLTRRGVGKGESAS